MPYICLYFIIDSRLSFVFIFFNIIFSDELCMCYVASIRDKKMCKTVLELFFIVYVLIS